MSPPASAAARGKPQAPSARAAAPPGTRQAPAFRRPRRISGPATARPRSAAAVPARALTQPARERLAPPAPRRRRAEAPQVDRSTRVCAQHRAALSVRALPRLLQPHRLWIGVVAFALIGIVTMQLVLLKLNTSIGHSLERAAQLQRQNDALSIAISEESSGEAVEQKGHAAGMVSVPPGELHFLAAGVKGDTALAAASLRARSVSHPHGIKALPQRSAASGYATASQGETSLEVPSQGEG